jgi:ABC-type multidrug transport system ATPase subunit
MHLRRPTSGLDPVVRENFMDFLTEINEQFNTTLIVINPLPRGKQFCNKVAIFGRKRGMIDFGNPRNCLMHFLVEVEQYKSNLKTFKRRCKNFRKN